MCASGAAGNPTRTVLKIKRLTLTKLITFNVIFEYETCNKNFSTTSRTKSNRFVHTAVAPTQVCGDVGWFTVCEAEPSYRRRRSWGAGSAYQSSCMPPLAHLAPLAPLPPWRRCSRGGTWVAYSWVDRVHQHVRAIVLTQHRAQHDSRNYAHRRKP